ncbi:MAG TPA: carboxypeptidase-like regulatory domain-containing protein [Gemmatimonadaceae bacterium]|nr:carboxypeptidase-like regulatory domain-containing protein [Gemmatimonadaceae bacterium]
MPSTPLSAAWAQRSDATGTIAGVVVATDGGLPLPYSIVSLPSLGLERLTNERGEFALPAPVGSAELFVRHLGYTPARLTITVRAGAVDSMRVSLSRLAVQLSAVQVHAGRVCTKPGVPNAAIDPVFAAVFDQLRQNADQYRLLSQAYPFTYDMERRSSIRYVSGELTTQAIDTVRLGTGTGWRYAPGSVVERSEDPRNRQVIFNIPALIHFADAGFLANHCFFSGGRDTADGSPAVRVDFLAASRLKTPDVDGSMYLDPATFQIRRSVLRLTRIPDETPQIVAVTVVTEFRTIVSSIAIASSISSTHRLAADTTRPVLPMAAYETQRLLRVTFLKIKPSGATPKF